MPTFSHPPHGWVLLLACLAVQILLRRWGSRSAIGAIMLVSVLHAAAALPHRALWIDEALLVLAFWLATAALLVADRRTRAEIARLIDASEMDEATGCYNRRGFAAQLHSVVDDALRAGTEIGVIALDLDHFKQVNDRYGHLSGDRVLYEVGAALVQMVGTRGIVARMGGEEFAVLLPGADAESAAVLAERIVADVRSRRFLTLPSAARLTMSAGIAAERATEQNIGAALRARADEALYAAKRSGRDRALLWAPGVHSNSTPAAAVIVVETPSGRHRRVSLRRTPT